MQSLPVAVGFIPRLGAAKPCGLRDMSHWKLYYHFVWGTKHRLPVIDAAIEPRLYRAIGAKVRELGGRVLALGGVQDHVHLVVSIPPKLAPAKFIGDVKGSSSHFINHVVTASPEFYWQDEYAVFSIDEKSLTPVVRYVNNQKEHHARGTVVAALEQDGAVSPR